MQVTNEANAEIQEVTLHFLSTRAADYGNELTTLQTSYNAALTQQNDDLYFYWTVTIQRAKFNAL